MLEIDGLQIKEVPIKPKEVQFDKDGKKVISTDHSGKRVDKIKIQGSEFKWVYEDGSAYAGDQYKLIKGRPVLAKGFSKTKIVKSYDTIDISDINYFVSNELTYLLVNKQFKERMAQLKGKALSFKFINRGFKVHRAVVYYDEQLHKVLMRCFRGNLKEMDLPEDEEINEIEETKEVGISLDDLEV